MFYYLITNFFSPVHPIKHHQSDAHAWYGYFDRSTYLVTPEWFRWIMFIFFSFSQYDTKTQQWIYRMVLLYQLRWNIWQFKKWLLRTFVECIITKLSVSQQLAVWKPVTLSFQHLSVVFWHIDFRSVMWICFSVNRSTSMLSRLTYF